MFRINSAAVPPALRLRQKHFDFTLAVDCDTVFLQKRRRYPVAGRQTAGERTIINVSAAAAWAAFFQNGCLTAVQPRQMQRLLGAPAVLGCDVCAVFHHNGLTLPFRRFARRGKPAQLLRTDGNKMISLHERDSLHDRLRFPVIPALNAEQAGADQNIFHVIGSFPRLKRLP